MIENGQKYCRIGSNFLSQFHFKATMPSALSDTTLNHTVHAISMLSYDIFYLQAKVFTLEVAFGKILQRIIAGGGAGIKMSWVEYF